MQFDRLTSSSPRTIEGDTWLHSDPIIIGKSDKQRRCIGWNDDLFPQSTGDGGRETTTTLGIELAST